MNDTEPVAGKSRRRLASAFAPPLTPLRVAVVLIACGAGTIIVLEGLVFVGLDPYAAASIVLAACLTLLYGARAHAALTRRRAKRSGAQRR